MTRPLMGRALALLLFAAAAPPAPAAEVYQISTISSLLASGYDGDATVASYSATATSGSARLTVWMGR